MRKRGEVEMGLSFAPTARGTSRPHCVERAWVDGVGECDGGNARPGSDVITGSQEIRDVGQAEVIGHGAGIDVEGEASGHSVRPRFTGKNRVRGLPPGQFPSEYGNEHKT